MLDRIKRFIKNRKLETLKPFGKNLPEKSLKITLCGNDTEATSAFVDQFFEIESVQIVLGNILNLDTTALVSPANSFGEMSGGLDKAIDNFYDQRAQKSAMTLVQEKYFGELPVGNAEILSMATDTFPYLILAPTMRIPGKLPADSINAYLAMRATLISILEFNRFKPGGITSVAIPSFCTGVGGMHFIESAKQMKTAYEMIILNKYKDVIHPSLAPYCL